MPASLDFSQSSGIVFERAKILPIITAEAPRDRAIAASPGPLMPPSAIIGSFEPYVRRASATCAVANTVGDPALVASIVVQMEPDPIPTLNPATPSSLDRMSSAA